MSQKQRTHSKNNFYFLFTLFIIFGVFVIFLLLKIIQPDKAQKKVTNITITPSSTSSVPTITPMIEGWVVNKQPAFTIEYPPDLTSVNDFNFVIEPKKHSLEPTFEVEISKLAKNVTDWLFQEPLGKLQTENTQIYNDHLLIKLEDLVINRHKVVHFTDYYLASAHQDVPRYCETYLIQNNKKDFNYVLENCASATNHDQEIVQQGSKLLQQIVKTFTIN